MGRRDREGVWSLWVLRHGWCIGMEFGVFCDIKGRSCEIMKSRKTY